MSLYFISIFLFLSLPFVFCEDWTPVFQTESQDITPETTTPSSRYCVITFMNSRNFITNLEILDAAKPQVERAMLSEDLEYRIDRYNCGGIRCNCWISFYELPDFKGKVLHKRVAYDFIRDGAYGGYISLSNDLAYINNPNNCSLSTWNQMVSSYKAVCYDFLSENNNDKKEHY